MFVNEVVIVQR